MVPALSLPYTVRPLSAVACVADEPISTPTAASLAVREVGVPVPPDTMRSCTYGEPVEAMPIPRLPGLPVPVPPVTAHERTSGDPSRMLTPVDPAPLAPPLPPPPLMASLVMSGLEPPRTSSASVAACAAALAVTMDVRVVGSNVG